mmetsp:Transcript_67250/g.160383  ORF Transcript_67250/g.160383 Transcript_67250/m.160383 type:complete len:254 (-) Transcript_67250:517-1278(-)
MAPKSSQSARSRWGRWPRCRMASTQSACPAFSASMATSSPLGSWSLQFAPPSRSTSNTAREPLRADTAATALPEFPIAWTSAPRRSSKATRSARSASAAHIRGKRPSASRVSGLADALSKTCTRVAPGSHSAARRAAKVRRVQRSRSKDSGCTPASTNCTRVARSSALAAHCSWDCARRRRTSSAAVPFARLTAWLSTVAPCSRSMETSSLWPAAAALLSSGIAASEVGSKVTGQTLTLGSALYVSSRRSCAT